MSPVATSYLQGWKPRASVTISDGALVPACMYARDTS
jgi:hypothetical protein